LVPFVGNQINGFTGAIVSAIAIFIASFFFDALLNPPGKKYEIHNHFYFFLMLKTMSLLL